MPSTLNHEWQAAGIEEHIGYPSELLDSQKLNDLYAGLELDSDHYLGNALNMTVFGTNYAFSKLRERVSERVPVDTDWPDFSLAYYFAQVNEIKYDVRFFTCGTQVYIWQFSSSNQIKSQPTSFCNLLTTSIVISPEFCNLLTTIVFDFSKERSFRKFVIF